MSNEKLNQPGRRQGRGSIRKGWGGTKKAEILGQANAGRRFSWGKELELLSSVETQKRRLDAKHSTAAKINAMVDRGEGGRQKPGGQAPSRLNRWREEVQWRTIGRN